jgi:hypothetical protein
LQDQIHLNDLGGALMAQLVMRHFRYQPGFPSGWAGSVRTYEVRRPLEEKNDEIQFPGVAWRCAVSRSGAFGESPAGPLRLEFRGNRVDVVCFPSGESALGTAKILIDGKAPSTFSQAYSATRPSPPPTIWFPSINRISLGANPIEETWTTTVTEISKDGKLFHFRAEGSVTGPDGEGTSQARCFDSHSGRVHIESADWSLAKGCAISGKFLPDPLTITWRVELMGTDVLRPRLDADKGAVDRYTLIQGIANTKHTLELIPNGDGPVPVSEIVVYRPPLD